MQTVPPADMGCFPGRNGSWIATELLDTDLQITAFGEDEGGEST